MEKNEMTKPRLKDIPNVVWSVTYAYKETVAGLIEHIRHLEAEYPGKELIIEVEATEEWYRYDPNPSHSMKMEIYYLREETDEEYNSRVEKDEIAKAQSEAWEHTQLANLKAKYDKVDNG